MECFIEGKKKKLERIKCNNCGSIFFKVKELETFLLLICRDCGESYMLDKHYCKDTGKWEFEKYEV